MFGRIDIKGMFFMRPCKGQIIYQSQLVPVSSPLTRTDFLERSKFNFFCK